MTDLTCGATAKVVLQTEAGGRLTWVLACTSQVKHEGPHRCSHEEDGLTAEVQW